jgi:hypothetical protein
MTEKLARKQIIAVGRYIMSEWESGRDWRWPTSGRTGTEKLKAIPLDRKWEDYRSLAAAWWFFYRVSEYTTDGMSTFDNLSWEEVAGLVEETVRRLEKGIEIEDSTVLHYMQNTSGGCNPFALIAQAFQR